MTADDLSSPLGQQNNTPRRKIRIPVLQITAGAMALFLGVFVLWATVVDDPYGGEPMVIVSADLHPGAAAKSSDTANTHEAASTPGSPGRYDGPPPTQGTPGQSQPPGTKTVTIINGKTGAHQDVLIPATSNTIAAPNTTAAPDAAAAPSGASVDQKFVEITPHGPVPKIAADGTRPAEAFARPVTPLPGKPDAPRIALIVGGLGVSTKATSDAIAKLPGPVTLDFTPYGADVASLVARARSEGHEVLLQVPMEPFDYPDNDPGPQTLLTSLTPQQNMDRLFWLMSRFQGYVGITNTMGARFTASEPSFGPILRETAKRGLIFVDDGSNPRSVAGRIAGANNLPFARADVVLDSVPTPAEIDHALGRLEMAARERGIAVGISSALPVSIEHIAKWAKAAQSRGLLLVPITAVAVKAKQS
jgi:uncharacterized protein